MTISWDDLSAWNLQHLELEPRTKILSPETIRKRWATIKFVGSFYNLLLYLLQWWKWIGSSGIWNGFPCFSAFQICHGFIHIKSRTVEAALRAPCFTAVFPAARMGRMARLFYGAIGESWPCREICGCVRVLHQAPACHIYIYMCVCVYIYIEI